MSSDGSAITPWLYNQIMDRIGSGDFRAASYMRTTILLEMLFVL